MSQQTAGGIERALVKAARDGDRAAIAQLLESGVYIIYATVRARVPESDVEDVIQEVRLAVFEALPDLNNPGTYRAWLRTITSRRIADHYKAGDKAVPVGLIQDHEDGFQDALEEAESWRVVEEMLTGLKPRYRVVLLLRAVEGLPFAEVGRHMDISAVAAEALFRRAKLKVFHTVTDFDPQTLT